MNTGLFSSKHKGFLFNLNVFENHWNNAKYYTTAFGNFISKEAPRKYWSFQFAKGKILEKYFKPLNVNAASNVIQL